MIFRRIVFLLLLLVGSIAHGSRLEVTIDNTKVPGNLTNFPVLISGANMPAAFWSNGEPDGSDIWVELADGTKLKRELVSIDTTAETMEMWVKVPVVSGSVDTIFYMHYGEGDSESNDDDVWDANYKAVIHGDDDDNRELFITTNADKGGQGLTNDGTYLYWGDSVGDIIYKYLISAADGSTPIEPIASFSGPVHCCGGAFWTDNGTMIWAEYNAEGVTSESLWEITTAGVKGTTWDVSGYGDGVGVQIAYKSEDNFYIAWIEDIDKSFHIQEITLNANGTITDGDEWIAADGEVLWSWPMSLLQGIVCHGTDIWVISGGAQTCLAKLTLATAPTMTSIYFGYGRYDTEPEGITILGDFFYWGTRPGQIWKSSLYRPYVGDNWYNRDSSGNNSFLIKLSYRNSTEVIGKIGTAQDFEISETPQSSKIELFPAGIRPMAAFAFEIWIYYETINVSGRVYEDGGGSLVARDVGEGNCQTAVYLGGAWRYSNNILISDMEDNWRLLGVSLNNVTAVLSFYLDGVLVGTVSGMTGSFGHVSNPIYIGSATGSSTWTVDAKMDELRISNTARSVDWFLTSYNNQNSPAAFYAVVAADETFDQRLERPLVSVLRRSRYDF